MSPRVARTADMLPTYRQHVDALESLIHHVDAARTTHSFQPSPDSIAANEASRSDALGRALSYGTEQFWLLVAGAEAQIGALMHLLRTADVVSPYTIDVLCRPAIECMARALWIVEPAIGATERCRRVLTERIYSAHELAELDPNLRAGALHSRKEILDVGTSVGIQTLPASKRSVTSYVKRPNATKLCAELLLDTDEDDFGRFVYKLLSATAHGTVYGLSRSLVSTGRSGVGGIELTRNDVVLRVRVLSIAYKRLMDRALLYYGWQDDTWTRVTANALGLLGHLIASESARDRL